MLIYIRENKTLGLKYYADMNDAPVTDILRQAKIETNNILMAFSDSSWQDCPDTGRVQENILFSIKVDQLTTLQITRDRKSVV